MTWWPRRQRRQARSAVTRRRMRALVTPEGLALEVEVASAAARLGALLIDLVLLVGAMVGFFVLLVWLNERLGVDDLAQRYRYVGTAQLTLMVIAIIGLFLFRNAWFLWFELGPRGATPGKRLLGLRIAARDGGRLLSEAVIARNILRDVEVVVPLLIVSATISGGGTRWQATLAGAAWFGAVGMLPLFTRDVLRAGDVIAGTWVLRAARARLMPALSTSEAAIGTSALSGVAYHFAEADLAHYGEHELRALERALRGSNDAALADVAEAICRKIGWTPGRGDERAFCEAYYTALRARLESGILLGRRKADKFSAVVDG